MVVKLEEVVVEEVVVVLVGGEVGGGGGGVGDGDSVHQVLIPYNG